MLRFENDYAEGAHEQILRRLIETNMVQVPGYGNDIYCDSAKEMYEPSTSGMERKRVMVAVYMGWRTMP